MQIGDTRARMGWGLALLLFGCSDDEVPEDAGDEDASVVVPDAAVDDGGMDATVGPPGPVVCEFASGDTCDEGFVCAPDNFCMPRCDERGACVVLLSSSWISAVVGEGPNAYVGTAATFDRFGNGRGDGQIIHLSDRTASTLSSTEPIGPTQLQIVGDHLYIWRQLDAQDPRRQQLWRIPKDASGAPEAIYPGSAAFCFLVHGERLIVKLADGIYLGSADGRAPLTMLLPANDSERDDPSPGSGGNLCTPLGLTDDTLFWRKDPPRMSSLNPTLASLKLGTSEVREHGEVQNFLGAQVLAANPETVIFSVMQWTGGAWVIRRSLLDRTAFDTILYRSRESESTGAVAAVVALRGDWVYAHLAISNPQTNQRDLVELERASIRRIGELQPILSTSFPRGRTFNTGLFTASETHLFYTAYVNGPAGLSGSVLYRVPMPAP